MLSFLINNVLTEEEETYLRQRFTSTCADLNISPKIANSLYDQVHFEYTDWSRHYHNLSHIFSLLKLREHFAYLVNNPALVDLAIWFHDIVYQSKRKDNERKSAELFEQIMRPYLEKKDLDFVCALILSTEGHQPLLPENNDNLIFLDFDLSILAADKKFYKKYAEAIREEYKSLFSFFVYNSGRKKVLKSFLHRKSLFFSDFFKEHYELRAKENINWEIKGLKEG
jgi:predicted metal-dependent HD superfamily phosphohydrolase